MTVATLGLSVESSQAVTAKTNLDKMTQAATAAEAAQQRLAAASAGANGALAKIASGVDQANAALSKLVSLMEKSNGATARADSAKQALAKTTIQETRASEGAVAATRQETAANDRLTESINRQEAAIAMRARARAAAGLDAWGRTKAEVSTHVASVQARTSPATSTSAIPVPANMQSDIAKAQAVTNMASEAARATGLLSAELMSAIVPANLLSFVIYSIAGAALEWAHSMLTGASQTEKALERHKALIEDIAKAYPQAADAAKKYQEYAERLPKSEVEAGLTSDTKTLVKNRNSEIKDLIGNLQIASTQADIFGEAAAKKFGELAEELQSGSVEAFDLRDQISKIALDPSIIGVARELVNILNEGAQRLAGIQGSIDANDAIRRTLRGGPEDARNSAAERRRQYDADNVEALFRARQQHDLAMQGIGARSPGEMAALARAREAAKPVTGNESAELREFNQNAKAAEAYAQALYQITQAQEQRVRSLNQGLASQQLDLTLVGKTAGEAARARFEFDHLAQIREQAIQQGITKEAEFQELFGKEVDLIKKAASEAGRYAEALARTKVAKDLAFEHDQLRRSTQDAAVAAMQRSAGLPIDLTSPEAQQMRANMEFSQAKDIAKNFLTTFENTLVSSGGDVGKAMGAAILSALMNSMTKQWEAIFDKVAIMFASALTGQKGGAGTGVAAVGSILGGANDNYAPGAITRAPLAPIGASAYRDAIASIESAGSGGYGALGPIHKTMGQALGRYQVMEANLPSWSKDALGRSVSRSEFLGNPSIQDAVFDNRFGGYVDKYGASGAASMWFTGRPSAPGAKDVLGTTGSAYVDKFNAALGKAGTNLNEFGSGLGKFGSALAQFPSTPGGGGGLLGKLFGGLSSAFSGTKAFSWLSANPGGSIGLYADGTENAPPGWAWVGEQGPELRKLRAGDVIRSNPRSMQMAANSNGGGMPAFSPVFHIDARNSTMSRAEFEQIARQQSQAAVAEYQRNQVRGGVDTTQKRYNSLKAG